MRQSPVSTDTPVRRRHRVLWETWQRSDVTQKEFARALHMSPQTFSGLLNLQRIPNPLGFTPEQQEALYHWTDMLPEELWPRPSHDFLDAPEVRGMVRVDIDQLADELADERMRHPDGDLGRHECARAMLGKLNPYTQRVIEQVAIIGKPGSVVGDDLLLSRQGINQRCREGIKRLRRLAQAGLIECCA